MKILLVEDDPSVSQFLSNMLSAHRYNVDMAADGLTGLALGTQGEYDSILLDIVVPKLDGLSVCRQLRRQGCQTPILMLTAKDSTEDIVTGLDAGADDYVTKPCNSSQLMARVRALLRRQSSALSSAILTWGALRLDLTLIQVTYKQQVIALSPKEYSLLELFLRHPQRIFSRSSIIDRLWSIDESPTEAAVTNLIKDLRRKLKAAGMMEELIETVYRLGYRLRVAPTAEREEKEEKANKEKGEKSCLEQEGLVLIEQAMQEFKASLAERLAVLDKAARSLCMGNISREQQEQANEEAHRLAGGLGTFGYARGSDLVREIEHLLIQQSVAEQYTQFSQLLAQLKQEIAQP